MTANLKKFLEFASKNEALKDRVTEIGRANSAETQEQKIEGLIQAAKEFGCELKIEDFSMAQTAGESSDEELEAVTGGAGLDASYADMRKGKGFEKRASICECDVLGMGDG